MSYLVGISLADRKATIQLEYTKKTRQVDFNMPCTL